MKSWSIAEQSLPPIDWKKEAELMRRGTAKLLKSKKAALRSLIAAGIDPSTGRVKSK